MNVKVLPGEPAQAGFLGTEVSRNESFQGNDSSWVESGEAGDEWRGRQGSGLAAVRARLYADRRVKTLHRRGGKRLDLTVPPDAGGVGCADWGCVSRGCCSKFPQIGGSEQQKCAFLFWRPEAQTEGVGRAVFHLRPQRRILPCHFQLLLAPGICSLAYDPVTPISASTATWPPSTGLSVSSPHPSRTPVMGFSVHPKSRMASAQDPWLMTSAKTPFPNKATM